VALQTVLDRFAEHRLLTLDRDPVTGSPTVEVAHEALHDQWPRLRRWIEDGRRDVLAHARLVTALTEWEASRGQPGYLLSGQRLADYEQWAGTSTLRLSTAEQRFLDVSIRQRESEQLAEEQRVAREIKLDRTAKRRLWVLGAVAVVISGLVGGFVLFAGGDQPAIAVVHGAPGDYGSSDMMISGADDAEREHDLNVEAVEPLVDAEATLRRLAESGTDLIIVGREFDSAVDTVAPDYPDVRWVAIDPDTVKIEGPNITEVKFAVQDSAFLAGAAAALTSETGTVGFIGGHQTLRTERSRNGFEQGALWIEPEITVVSMYIGPVTDPYLRAETQDDLAYDLASTMYADGVDVIFHDAGPAGIGVTRAANDRSTTTQPVWTIGSDADEYLTLPPSQRGVVLSSTIKEFDRAVRAAVTDFLDGELAAGETTLGLADDGVSLSRSGNHLTAVDGQLKNLEGELASGHITVSPYATRPPQWQTQPDAVIELTLRDDACALDRVVGAELADAQLPVAREGVVVVELTNASSDFGGLTLRTAPVGTSTAALEAAERGGNVPAPELDLAYLSQTTVELGGRTSTAALVSEPIAIACWRGEPPPNAYLPSNYPMIVRPS
jgi:basic membrane protein A